MIGVIQPLGSGFKGAVMYVGFGRDGRQQDRVAWAEFYNLPTRDFELAACFMAATANASVSGTRTPVYSFMVSFDLDDPVDEATMRRVARRTLRDMGLEEHEAVVAAHRDRSHPHLHFVVNRVHPERATLWRKWWDFPRLERSLRAQEVELGLRVVPGWHAPVPSLDRAREGHTEGWQPGARWIKPLPGPKRGDPGFLRDVAERAAPILAQVRSWATLERSLAEQGLALTVKGGGFRITGGKHYVKASEVGPAFSRYHLEKQLGRYPDYRARMAVADIGPVRRSERIVVAPPSVRPRRIPQFGDAGYGINELFGPVPARGAERPGVGVEPGLAPTPVRGSARFLKQVRAQAGPVLENANTWEELKRGLARHGLTLRAKGGGFVLTDGAQEVKASAVGRAFSGSRLKERLDRRPEGGAPAIEAAAPPAPVVLPATPRLRRAAAAQPIAATVRHADLDEQHQPIRSAHTPQFGDAGHGIDELFGYAPAREREKPAPALEHAPVPQLSHAETQVTLPEEFGDEHAPAREDDAGPINGMDLGTSAASTTTAPALVETPEPSQTAEPDREEVAAPAVTDHPVTANKVEVERARGPQRRCMQRKRIARSEQVELWSEVLAPSEPTTAAPADQVVAQDQPAPAREEIPEVVPGTPLPSVAPESSLPPEQVSAPEPPQMPEPAGENVPAAASADHDHSTQTELSARIERLRQKASLQFMGETLTGASSDSAASAPHRHPEIVTEQVWVEIPRLPAGAWSADAEAFVRLAERCREMTDRIQDADATRARVEKLSRDLRGADRDVNAATMSFANEITSAFQDPNGFWTWFKQFPTARRWEMLATLRERPADVAREFLAASGGGHAQTNGSRSTMRRVVTWTRTQITGKKPEHPVFRATFSADTAHRPADAGERYLQALEGRERLRVRLTRQLGMPRRSPLQEVRDALATRMDEATARKAEAIDLRDSVGARSSAVERAFRALSREDQRVVMNALPTLGKLIPTAARLLERLARGPERKDGGLGL